MQGSPFVVPKSFHQPPAKSQQDHQRACIMFLHTEDSISSAWFPSLQPSPNPSLNKLHSSCVKLDCNGNIHRSHALSNPCQASDKHHQVRQKSDIANSHPSSPSRHDVKVQIMIGVSAGFSVVSGRPPVIIQREKDRPVAKHLQIKVSGHPSPSLFG